MNPDSLVSAPWLLLLHHIVRNKYHGNTVQRMTNLSYMDRDSKLMEWHVQMHQSEKVRCGEEFGLATK